MIEVKITEHGIRMHGHAGYSKNGHDPVCAAVSALTCNLIISLRELTADNLIRADTGSGLTVIEWEKMSESGRLLTDAWFLGLTAVNQEYNCITFI